MVDNFYYNPLDKKTCFNGRRLIHKSNLFEQPIPSVMIGLTYGNFSETIEKHNVDDIIRKCIKFEFENQIGVATLLHKNEKYAY